MQDAFDNLAVPGETVEFATAAGGRFAILTPLALYVGDDDLRRFPRAWITGIEFDRTPAKRGAMVFVGRDGILDRLEFGAAERADLVELESRLAGGQTAPPAPVVAARVPRRDKGITVILDQPAVAPGETLRGTVVVDWPKDAPVRGIRVGVAGAESTRISVSKGSGKSRRTVTYRETNPIIGEELLLHGRAPVSFMKAVGEGFQSLFGGLRHPALKRGRHEFTFDFRIPQRALPSHAGPHATVRYDIYANVDVPLGFDLVTSGEILVVPPRGTRLESAGGIHHFKNDGVMGGFKAAGKMNVEVSGAPLEPGHAVEGRITAENRSRKRLKSARFSLKKLEHARAGHYERDSEVEILAGALRVPDPSAPEIEAVFGLKLPAQCAPYAGRYSSASLVLDVTLEFAWSFDVTARLALETVR